MEISWHEKHCKIILDRGEEVIIKSKHDPRCPFLQVSIDEYDDITYCRREDLAHKKNKKVK